MAILTKDKVNRYYELLNNDENLKEFVKCRNSYLYFIKNYYQIITLDKGQQLFEPYPFQEDFLETIHNNRFFIGSVARQSGKSTVVAAYLLWYALFNNDKTIAIVANKLDMSKEILKRIKFAYDYLEEFLKQPLVTDNKMKLEFLNGSRIIAFATSSSALRGMSVDIMLMDEFAFVPFHVAKDFEKSVLPVVSSSQTSKVVIISTPNGLNSFYRKFEDAKNGRNEYQWRLYDWTCVPSRDEKWAEEQRKQLGDDKSFEQEFECKFLSSSNSVFNYEILNKLGGQIGGIKPEIELNKIGMKIYTKELKSIIELSEDEYTPEQIEEKRLDFRRSRFMVIDTGEGLEQDYSVCNIMKFDLDNFKIIQEGLIRSNSLSIDMFANIVYSIGEYLGYPYVFFENNNKSGGEFSKVFVDKLGYTNCYIGLRNKQTKKTDVGIYTTNSKKRIGVKTLINLIEKNIIQINNYDTFLEMNYFEENPPFSGKFQAQQGYTDDIIMSYVIFSYVYQTDKDFFGLNFGRKSVIDAMLNPVLIDNNDNIHQETDIEIELEEKLLQKINNRRKEDLDEYDFELETEEGMKLNLREAIEFGANFDIYHTGGSISKEENYNKMNKKNILGI